MRAVAEAVGQQHRRRAVRPVDDRRRRRRKRVSPILGTQSAAVFGRSRGGCFAAHAHKHRGARSRRRMEQHLMRQPLDGAQPVAAGATGRVAVAQAGCDVGHAGSAIQRQDLDAGRSLRDRPRPGSRRRRRDAKGSAPVRSPRWRPARRGFIVAKRRGQAADSPAGMRRHRSGRGRQWLPWCYFQRRDGDAGALAGLGHDGEFVAQPLGRRQGPDPCPCPLV